MSSVKSIKFKNQFTNSIDSSGNYNMVAGNGTKLLSSTSLGVLSDCSIKQSLDAKANTTDLTNYVRKTADSNINMNGNSITGVQTINASGYLSVPNIQSSGSVWAGYLQNMAGSAYIYQDGRISGQSLYVPNVVTPKTTINSTGDITCASLTTTDSSVNGVNIGTLNTNVTSLQNNALVKSGGAYTGSASTNMVVNGDLLCNRVINSVPNYANISYYNTSVQEIPRTTLTNVTWAVIDASQTVNTVGLTLDAPTGRFTNSTGKQMIIQGCGFVNWANVYKNTGGAVDATSTRAVVVYKNNDLNNRYGVTNQPAGKDFLAIFYSFTLVLANDEYFSVAVYHDDVNPININALNYPGSRLSLTKLM